MDTLYNVAALHTLQEEQHQHEQAAAATTAASAASEAAAASASGQTVAPGGSVGTRGSHILEQHVSPTPTLAGLGTLIDNSEGHQKGIGCVCQFVHTPFQ